MEYFNMQAKQFFKSWSSVFVFAFPMLFLLSLGTLLPSGMIIPASITISITASILFTFAPNLFNLRKTSMMKTLSLTNLNKWSVMALSSFFSLLISLFGVASILIVSYFVSTYSSFFPSDFSHFNSEWGPMLNFEINWRTIDWFGMIYGSVWTILVTFALAFMIVSITKTTISFYLALFIYLLLQMTVGGIIIPNFFADFGEVWFRKLYWIIPHYYTNNLITNSFTTDMTHTWEKIMILYYDSILTDYLKQAISNSDPTLYAHDQEMLNDWIEAGMPTTTVKINIDTGDIVTKGSSIKWGVKKIDVNIIDWAAVDGYTGKETFNTKVFDEFFGVSGYKTEYGLNKTYMFHIQGDLRIKYPFGGKSNIFIDDINYKYKMTGEVKKGFVGAIALNRSSLWTYINENVYNFSNLPSPLIDIQLPQLVATQDDFILKWNIYLGTGSTIFINKLITQISHFIYNDAFNKFTPGNVDHILDNIRNALNTPNFWDTSTLESTLNLVMPSMWTVAFTGIGIYYFKWTIR